ncbi:XRE family transcriptional regulator [Sphingomonas arantia]|uniref:XRE family transcriptional regulator n=1 Tax=Sphingomonas arantia TaxID=1460676 RepID=A0ABW4U0S2_9SPHN
MNKQTEYTPAYWTPLPPVDYALRMSVFASNVAAILREHRQEAVAAACGVSQPTISRWVNGAVPKLAGLQLLAQYVGATVHQLTEVPMAEWHTAIVNAPAPPSSVVPDQAPTRSVSSGELAQVARLDLSLPMGPGATVDDFVEDEPLTFELSYVRSFTRTPPHRLKIAQGVGDSMFPTLVSADLVWIDTTQNQLLHSDRIYAASINGGAAIKRLRPVAGGKRVLVISDNKTIEPYEVDADDVVIWGRVIRFARDL